MNRTLVPISAACLVCALSPALAGGPSGGPYEITWSTIDSGGVLNSSGGPYTLSGTIGQHDASGELNGGSFTLTGGFWAGISNEPCPADLDGNGLLNFGDVTAFLTFYGMNDLIVDFDNNGSLNFGDVTAFLTLYGMGCP